MASQPNIYLLTNDQWEERLIRVAVNKLACKNRLRIFSQHTFLLNNKIAEDNPIIIIDDLTTPHEFEYLTEIRKDVRFENAPIIVFTGDISPTRLKELICKGADLFFSRPRSFKEMFITIQSLLSRNWSLS